MFGLVTGRILIHKKFPTYEEAKEWGEWNARGRGEYTVVPIEADGGVTLPPREKKPRGKQCVCDRNETAGRKYWDCPIHGRTCL